MGVIKHYKGLLSAVKNNKFSIKIGQDIVALNISNQHLFCCCINQIPSEFQVTLFIFNLKTCILSLTTISSIFFASPSFLFKIHFLSFVGRTREQCFTVSTSERIGMDEIKTKIISLTRLTHAFCCFYSFQSQPCKCPFNTVIIMFPRRVIFLGPLF